MLKNCILSVAAALLLAANCSGAGDEGTSGGQFLRIGVGAKASALGETGAVVSGVQSFFYNPAGLNDVRNIETSFSQVQWVRDVNYSNLAFAKKAGAGVYGAAVSYLSMPPIQEYNNLGVRLPDTYSASDMAVALGYARMLTSRLGLGLTAKYISSKLESETASAAAADAGLKYEILPEALSAGFAVQNLGTPLKYVSKSEALPLNVKIGGEYALKFEEGTGEDNKILFFSDLNHMRDAGFYANFGVDLLVKYSEEASFSVRCGYKTNVSDKGAGFSAGFGADMKKYVIDYSYSPMGDLGKAQRLSFTLRFEGKNVE